MRTLPFLALIASPALAQAPVDDGTPNLPDTVPAFAEQTDAPQISSGIEFDEHILASSLVRPWSIAVLPGDAGYLITERGGALVHLTRDGTIGPAINGVPDVRAMQQGGMLDVTLAVDFAERRVIYLT